MSASYVAGFNNHVAVLGAAALSVAVLLWSWFAPGGKRPGEVFSMSGGRLGPWRVGCFVAMTCAYCLLWFLLLRASQLRYLADAGYFIEQISAHAEYGRQLYRQLEFAYGPLLFYPTVWIQKVLHCSWLAAYFCTLGLEQSLGLLELAFLLNALPLSAESRRFALPLLALGALNPLLGLNYTLFRYLTPFFGLAVAAKLRRNGMRAFALFASAVVCFGISVEIGGAFCAGAFVLVIWQCMLRSWADLWLGFVPVAGAAAFFLSFGSGYLRMLRSFAQGALNLPVAPYPHILVFLFAGVWLVPRLIASVLRTRREDLSPIPACYAAALTLFAPALGRCDPLHVLFNGAGLLLLSLVAAEGSGRGARVAWFVALLVLVGWEQGVTHRIFRYRTADTLGLVVMPRLPASLSDWLLDTAADSDPVLALHLQPHGKPDPLQANASLPVTLLDRDLGRQRVVTPLEITPQAEQVLKQSLHYEPMYYAFMVDVFSRSAETTAIKQLNEAEWALLPRVYGAPFIETPDDLTDIQGFVFPYRHRHDIPFAAGKAFAVNLEKHWSAAHVLGDYVLWQRNRDD